MKLAPETISVVVVDNDEDNADMLAALLEEYGHPVRIAYGGARALELLEQELPSVVFLDLGLPEMDGFEVAAAMRARFGGAFRIIAVTGYSGAAERERARRAEIDSFLTKPLQTGKLQALLDAGTQASA